MQLVIKGDCPSKKNSKRIFRNKYTGKPFIASGEVHERWFNDALPQLKGIRPVATVSSAELVFYPQTRRSADLTNRAESVMDLLVKAKIIEDDNWFVVPKVSLLFGAVDKDNPRVEISLT